VLLNNFVVSEYTLIEKAHRHESKGACGLGGVFE
jgi:hypothetical protein